MTHSVEKELSQLLGLGAERLHRVQQVPESAGNVATGRDKKTVYWYVRNGLVYIHKSQGEASTGV